MHFHSTCFAFKYEDDLYPLNLDGMLRNILVSFFVDMHVLCSKARACAVSFMPDPEITWMVGSPAELVGKQVTTSHRWHLVKNLMDQEEITIQHKMDAKKDEVTNEEAKKDEITERKRVRVMDGCYPEDRPKIRRQAMTLRLQPKWGGVRTSVDDHLSWKRPLVWGG